MRTFESKVGRSIRFVLKKFFSSKNESTESHEKMISVNTEAKLVRNVYNVVIVPSLSATAAESPWSKYKTNIE